MFSWTGAQLQSGALTRGAPRGYDPPCPGTLDSADMLTSHKRSSLLRRSKKVLYPRHFVVVAGDFGLRRSLNSNALKIEEKLSENYVGGTIKGASGTKILLVSLKWC